MNIPEERQEIETEFERDWTKFEKYDFKILTLIAVLANENRAYRGTVTQMCEFFGVSSRTASTREAIENAIDKVREQGYLDYMLHGKTYTLTLVEKAEKKSKVVKIHNSLIKMADEFKSEKKTGKTTWDNTLRVWIYLIDNKKEIIKSREIAADLNISKDVVDRAKEVLIGIGVVRCKDRYKKVDENKYQRLGQSIDVKAWVE